jgi:predicted  nucleic acid-binding Zn-ribbon protein
VIDQGLLSGLPSGVQALLGSPPLNDPRLLELAARWEELPPAQARIADALRLFVVTWDPLEWLAPRPEAVATANAWPLELVVYVPVWSLADIARRTHTTMAAVLAGFGGSAITTAAAHEDAVVSGRYAELAAQGKVPDLLAGEPGPAVSEVAIAAVSPEWEGIGLGAITDFVQQACGPVDFDRSLVELTATSVPLPGCPACGGRRFKFPADLADSRDRMCQAHQKEADGLIKRRIARAEASNPAGWRMIADASARLSLPHLPGGLATRLKAAENDLVSRARLLAEAAAGFPGRPDDFGSALAEDHDQAGRFPGWPAALIRDLGRAGEGTEAVTLSEALARVDPASRAFFGGQAALALSEAGLADDARVKIAELVEAGPDDVQTRMLAGDALALLCDAEAALAQYQAALPLAQQAKNYRATRELSEKIFRLTHSGSAQPTVQRRQLRSRPSRSQRKGKR